MWRNQDEPAMRSAMQLAGPESSSPIFWLAPRKVDVLVAPPGPALPEQLCRFDPPPPGVALTLDSYFDELRRDRGEGSFHELMESVDKTFAERKSSDAYSEQVLKGPGPLTSLEIADASTYVRALCDESADGAFHVTVIFMQEAHMALAVAAAAREFVERVETAEPLANLGRDLLGFSKEADRKPPPRLVGVDPAAWSLDYYYKVVAGMEMHWKYAPSTFAAGAASVNEILLLISRCRMSRGWRRCGSCCSEPTRRRRRTTCWSHWLRRALRTRTTAAGSATAPPTWWCTTSCCTRCCAGCWRRSWSGARRRCRPPRRWGTPSSRRWCRRRPPTRATTCPWRGSIWSCAARRMAPRRSCATT